MERFVKYDKTLIKVSNKNRKIERIDSKDHYTNASIYGEWIIPSTSRHIYIATIKIIKIPKPFVYNISFGIDGSNGKWINHNFAGQKSSINYSYSNMGFIESNNTINRRYGDNKVFKKNDNIKMELNLYDETLIYYKNNEFLGIAFNNIKIEKNLNYSLAIYLGSGCCVKLLSTKKQKRFTTDELLQLLISGYIKHIQKRFQKHFRIPNDMQSLILLFCGKFIKNNKSKDNGCYEWKMAVLGAGGVGKSALVIRLVANNFLESYDPTIEDSYRKLVVIDNKECLLDILDSAGQDEYCALQQMWLPECESFIFVYSITSRYTFDEVSLMKEKLLSPILSKKEYNKYYSIVLVGNKCDLEDQRQVTTEEGEELAKEWGDNVCFYETSAKQKINNEICFYDGIRVLRKQYIEGSWISAFDLEPNRKRKRCIIQ